MNYPEGKKSPGKKKSLSQILKDKHAIAGKLINQASVYSIRQT